MNESLLKTIDNNISLMEKLRYWDVLLSFIKAVRNGHVKGSALEKFPIKLKSMMSYNQIFNNNELVEDLIKSHLIFQKNTDVINEKDIQNKICDILEVRSFYQKSKILVYKENDKEHLMVGKYQEVFINNEKYLLWLISYRKNNERRYIHVLTDANEEYVEYVGNNSSIDYIFSFLPDNFKGNIMENIMDTTIYPLGKIDKMIANLSFSGKVYSISNGLINSKTKHYILDFIKIEKKKRDDGNKNININELITNYSSWVNLPKELRHLAKLIRDEHLNEIICKLDKLEKKN